MGAVDTQGPCLVPILDRKYLVDKELSDPESIRESRDEHELVFYSTNDVSREYHIGDEGYMGVSLHFDRVSTDMCNRQNKQCAQTRSGAVPFC